MYNSKEFHIRVMEAVILKQYENIANEINAERRAAFEDQKDTMVMTLIIMGYNVICDVDASSKVTAVHISEL